MPRCGCADSCSCLVVAGDGISVEGIGTLENPYEITSESSDLVGRVEFTDEGNVDFTQSGVGTLNDPLVVFGDAVLDLGDLSDVPDTEPAEGDILVWRLGGWSYEQPAAGSGVPPGGTDGQVLTKQSDLDGDAIWEDPTGGGGGGAVMEPPVKAVYGRTAALSYSNTSGTYVVWDTVEEAAEGITYNATTGIFTVVSAGMYLITARMRFNFVGATAAAYNQMRIYKNGAIWDFEQVPFIPTGTGAHTVAISRQMTLAVGDTVGITINPGGATFSVDMVAQSYHSNSVEISKKVALAPGGGGVVVERPVNAFRRHLAATSILNATVTAVPFDSEMNSDGITWDAGQSAFIAPSDGYYDVEFGLTYAPNATGTRVGYIQVNGVSWASATGGGADLAISGSGTVKALAGQAIRIATQQTAGVSLTLNGNANYNWFSVTKVPAAYAGSAVSTYGERNYAALRRTIVAQSFGNGVLQDVTWEIEQDNNGIPFDGTATFTIPVAGYYAVEAAVHWASGTTGYRSLRLSKNGSSAAQASTQFGASSSGGSSAILTRTLLFAAGDLVKIVGIQGSGATVPLTISDGFNYVSITKVPAPVVNGAAASGVWGVGPLDSIKYGVTSDLLGREVYIDSKGQLRTNSGLIQSTPAAKTPASLPAEYPLGTSVLTVGSADASNYGWPPLTSCTVVTHVRPDAVMAGQWCYLNSTTLTKAWYRNGQAGGWSPWVQVVGADTGWLPVTVNAGFAAEPSAPPMMRKIGNVVHMKGGWITTGVAANTSYSVGTLPVAIEKPVTSFYLSAGVNTGSVTAQFLIGSGAGTGIQLRTGPTLGTNYWLYGTYLID